MATEVMGDARESAGMGISRPSREKYWKELTADEKADRMRVILKQAIDKIERLEDKIETMTQHIHADGKVVVQIDINERLPLRKMKEQRHDEDSYF